MDNKKSDSIIAIAIVIYTLIYVVCVTLLFYSNIILPLEIILWFANFVYIISFVSTLVFFVIIYNLSDEKLASSKFWQNYISRVVSLFKNKSDIIFLQIYQTFVLVFVVYITSGFIGWLYTLTLISVGLKICTMLIENHISSISVTVSK